MHRRAYLRTAVAGAVAGTAGCAGGKVLHSTSKTVKVTPGNGWIQKLPADADEIKFIAKDDRPFDVYVFTDPSNVKPYEAYIQGEQVDRKPAGNKKLGGRATRMSDDLYMITTKEKGREPLKGKGPAYFVLDHSDYRNRTVPAKQPKPLDVVLDLKAVKSTLPI